MHLALITGTFWALLCYIWTCTCATKLICVMTLSYNIVQIIKELFQEMYTGSPWFVQPVQKIFKHNNISHKYQGILLPLF